MLHHKAHQLLLPVCKYGYLKLLTSLADQEMYSLSQHHVLSMVRTSSERHGKDQCSCWQPQSPANNTVILKGLVYLTANLPHCTFQLYLLPSQSETPLVLLPLVNYFAQKKMDW